MRIGEYRRSRDPKGRVSFPVRLRETRGDSFIICEGLDHCLYVYRLQEWEKLIEKTAALPSSKARTIQRFFFASAFCAESDKQGRVLIPQNLREHAGLRAEITIVGVSTRAEIWDSARWDEVNAALTCESIAETMDELGF